MPPIIVRHAFKTRFTQFLSLEINLFQNSLVIGHLGKVNVNMYGQYYQENASVLLI